MKLLRKKNITMKNSHQDEIKKDSPVKENDINFKNHKDEMK